MYKEIEGFPGYLVSESGRVYSKKSNKFLSIVPNKQTGYPQVALWKDGRGYHLYLHRILATAFIPNPKNLPEINHIDGNRQNFALTNLEWVDSAGNKQHAIRTGLKVYTNRLTKDEFIQCLYDVITGESYFSLSQRVPYKVPFLSTKIRSIAKELGLEEALDTSLREQRTKRSKENGRKAAISKKAQRLSH